LHAHAERSEVRVDGSDLAFVEIAIADATGIVAVEEVRDVRVGVDGPGELIPLGSAQPDSEERFDSDSRRSFNGRVLAVVRPTGPGDIVVRAIAEGLRSDEVTIRAVDVPVP